MSKLLYMFFILFYLVSDSYSGWSTKWDEEDNLWHYKIFRDDLINAANERALLSSLAYPYRINSVTNIWHDISEHTWWGDLDIILFTVFHDYVDAWALSATNPPYISLDDLQNYIKNGGSSFPKFSSFNFADFLNKSTGTNVLIDPGAGVGVSTKRNWQYFNALKQRKDAFNALRVTVSTLSAYTSLTGSTVKVTDYSLLTPYQWGYYYKDGGPVRAYFQGSGDPVYPNPVLGANSNILTVCRFTTITNNSLVTPGGLLENIKSGECSWFYTYGLRESNIAGTEYGCWPEPYLTYYISLHTAWAYKIFRKPSSSLNYGTYWENVKLKYIENYLYGSNLTSTIHYFAKWVNTLNDNTGSFLVYEPYSVPVTNRGDISWDARGLHFSGPVYPNGLGTALVPVSRTNLLDYGVSNNIYALAKTLVDIGHMDNIDESFTYLPNYNSEYTNYVTGGVGSVLVSNVVYPPFGPNKLGGPCSGYLPSPDFYYRANRNWWQDTPTGLSSGYINSSSWKKNRENFSMNSNLLKVNIWDFEY